MNKTYKINIIGTGNKEDIVDSLQQILDDIKWLPSDSMDTGDSYGSDDNCLNMVITEIEEPIEEEEI